VLQSAIAALNQFNCLILDELHENCKHNKWTFVYDQSRLKDGPDSIFPTTFNGQRPVGALQGEFRSGNQMTVAVQTGRFSGNN
jgi:hypothetical protein